MSYSRETHYSGDPVIVFWYLREALFNDVMTHTLYRAKNIIQTAGNETGKSMVDDFAMTEDERDAFYIFARTAIYDAFAQVVKMTKGLTDTVFINDGVYIGASSTSGVVEEDASYGFIIYDHEAYNANVLQLVDNEILKFMRYEILFNWFQLSGVESEAEKYKIKWDESRRDLVNKYLFQLRKPLLT